MKVIHLISGGDVGGAKTHVLSLLRGLGQTQTVRLVCFMEGAFSREAREMGIETIVLTSGNFFFLVKTLKNMIVSEGFDIVHCHGSRANLMGAMLRKATGLPVVMWDERRTTVEAHNILSAHNYHGKKRKDTVDAVAASLILEGYLAFRK